MTTEHDLSPPDTVVPDLTPGYPSKGPRQGAAWVALWTKLDQDEYLDGVELAKEVSEAYGLTEATLLTLLSHAARLHLLERDKRSVYGGRGPRPRSFYRVNQEFVTGLRKAFANSDRIPYAAEYTGKGKG